MQKLHRNNDYFSNKKIRADLKQRSLQGGAITIINQIARFVLMMSSTMILARLLTPKDYGIVGMVTAITGFAAVFKDMGLSTATIQKDHINHDQISALFWINVIVCFIIMLIIASFAPVIAWFYDSPQLISVTLLISSSFLFSGIAIQHHALLIRMMQFTSIAFIELCAQAMSVVIAVYLAWHGAGLWALVAMIVSQSIFAALLTWLFCHWRPSFPKNFSGIRSMVIFGGHMTGSNLLTYLAKNVDYILIGRFWGPEQLGFYTKAYKLLLLPIEMIINPIGKVVVPALSHLQNDGERYRRYYHKSLFTIALITGPITAVIISLSEEIIAIVLGAQWLPAVIIFKVLGLLTPAHPLVNSSGWVFISTGETKRLLQFGFLSAPATIISFAIGLPWGALGVATAYVITAYLLIIPKFIFAAKFSPLKNSDIIRPIWRPYLASFIMYLSVVHAKVFIMDYSLPYRLALSLTIGFSVYLTLIFLMPTTKSLVSNLFSDLVKTRANGLKKMV